MVTDDSPSKKGRPPKRHGPPGRENGIVVNEILETPTAAMASAAKRVAAEDAD